MFWLLVLKNQFDRRNDKAHPLLGEASRNDGYLLKLKGMHTVPTREHDDEFCAEVEKNAKDEEKLKQMSEIPFDAYPVVPHVCCLVVYEYIMTPFKCCCKNAVEDSKLGNTVKDFETGIRKMDEGNDIYNFRQRSHSTKMFRFL